MTASPPVSRRNTRALAALFGAVTLGAACTAAPLQAQITLLAPKPVAAPKPFARLSASAQSMRDSLVALTRRQLGVPYRRGESSPEDGFDCSGLASYVMARFGASLPRTSREQALVGKKIERNVAALRPGDLLTFGHGKRISHVGIYIGNGVYVHAPSPGRRVREQSLAHTRMSWWKGARRVLAVDDPAGADSGAN